MTDDDLIARHIRRDDSRPRRPDEARLARHGASMWVLCGLMLAHGVDEMTTAYRLTPEQAAAVVAFYARHRAVIDARLTLNAADW